MADTMEIKGFVTQVIYRNPSNAYTVFQLCPDREIDSYLSGKTEYGDDRLLTCTGYPSAIREGEPCTVTGEMVEHPSYGAQLRVERYEPGLPADRTAVFFYLASGAVKGIGRVLADRIVSRFGDDTMRILTREPERLAEVKGIGERQAREIAAQFAEREEERDVCLFLAGFEITGALAAKIYERYRGETFRILRENPYRLCSEMRGITFARADAIARRGGIGAESDVRLASGLASALRAASESGSTCLPREELLETAARLLELERGEHLELILDNEVMEGHISAAKNREGTCFYLPSALSMERRLAGALEDLLATGRREADGAVVERVCASLSRKRGISLDPLQAEAVRASMEEPVLVLIGGPGTGKTTTIRGIIAAALESQTDFRLCAPTGRAARRMQEACGFEATTIHRLLRAEGAEETGNAPAADWDGDRSFYYNDSKPLECDLVIVDEVSMVDEPLMDALLRALLPTTRLILVGDDNQLPSVGPGSVLRDIKESGLFRVIELKKIFRQALESDIVRNAHRILEGEKLVLDNRSRDFFFLERSSVPVIYKHTVELLRDKLPGYVGCDFSEIQVLTPTKKGPLGTKKLNEVLQSVLNPPERGRHEHSHEGTLYREGDKVMQTSNDYELVWHRDRPGSLLPEEGKGVFNGEFGRIEEIDAAGQCFRILFDEGRRADYPFEKLDSLDLAWAITVHKSQGSEYPGVIMPILVGPRLLFHRRLLYTALTRAKRTCVILGSSEVLAEMAENVREDRRHTGLQERLREMTGTGEREADEDERYEMPW